ncbi:MAG TPA: LuxR C-terminal-related transcriptional regulator [Solirubrobacteraceae bacterium]
MAARGAIGRAGRSTAEVAQQLFVSLNTIETHLTRVYTKLGLSGPGARRGPRRWRTRHRSRPSAGAKS